MAQESSCAGTPPTMKQEGEYAAYVHRLHSGIHEFSTLADFLRQKVPRDWIEDEITIYDLQESSWTKSKYSSGPKHAVAGGANGSDQPRQGEESLVQKLDNYPDGTRTRIICVDQLTPTTVELLGLKYNLTGDYFNDHLPHSRSSTPLGAATSIHHFDFEQMYFLEKPFGDKGLFAGEKFEARYRDKYDFIWFCSIFVARSRHYVSPDFDLNFAPERACFNVDGRISLFTGQYSGIQLGRPLNGYLHTEGEDIYDSEIHTELDVDEGRELVPRPSSLEAFRSSRTLSTASKFCINLDFQLNLQNWHQLHSSYLWIYPLFQILEQKASKEIYHTISKLNLAEEQVDIDDTNQVWKEASASTRKIAAQQVRLRGMIKHMEDLEDEVMDGSHNATSSAAELLEFTQKWKRLKRRFNEILQQSHDVLSRAEKVTSTFLAYVQLDESRRAVKQTESVRRLTNLAFVFLPLSLVAGIFSASIQEMDGHRSAKAFTVSCILTTAIAIVAALTLEQYLYVWFSWPFLKWRSWLLGEMDMESLVVQDRRSRILKGSRGWFWLVVESGRIFWSWLKFHLYIGRRNRNASKARSDKEAMERQRQRQRQRRETEREMVDV